MSSYHSSVTALLQGLTAQAASLEELVFISQMSASTVTKWIKTWREAGLVFVASWDADARGCMTIPRYQWGAEQDVPAPSKPTSQRVAEWRARKKGQQ